MKMTYKIKTASKMVPPFQKFFAPPPPQPHKDDYCKALTFLSLEVFYDGLIGYVLDFVDNVAMYPTYS